jgi:hypothetical protein
MTYLHQFFVFFGQMLKTTREHCKKLMQVSIDSEINSLEHEKSKHTCIFIYYHLPNVGAVGSEVLLFCNQYICCTNIPHE